MSNILYQLMACLLTAIFITCCIYLGGNQEIIHEYSETEMRKVECIGATHEKHSRTSTYTIKLRDVETNHTFTKEADYNLYDKVLDYKGKIIMLPISKGDMYGSPANFEQLCWAGFSLCLTILIALAAISYAS